MKTVVFFFVFLLTMMGLGIGNNFENQSNPIKFSTNNLLFISDTIFVDDDFDSSTPGWGVNCFDSISNAIEVADSGNVVYVYNGIYYDHLVINKPITLIGENHDSTVIDGNWESTSVIAISSDSVTIQQFKIQHGSDQSIWTNKKGNKIKEIIFGTNGDRAVYINGGEGNNIENNIFKSGSKGVLFYEADKNDFENNEINTCIVSLDYNCNSNNLKGNIFHRSGIYTYQGDSNIIESNIFKFNSSNCIWFDYVSHASIINNKFISNESSALYLHASNDNNIIGNLFAANGNAISLPDCMCGGSNHNYIFHNNWIDNDQIALDESDNYWNDDYPSGGNYYDTYSGFDYFYGINQNIPGSDSIGDSPQNIPGGNEQDHYPLMFPYEIPPFADTIYVDDDFTELTQGWNYDHFDNIQEGVIFAAKKGIVFVANGIYNEKIKIGKKVSLIGQSRDSTIINGSISNTVVRIYADSVEFINFTVRNGYLGSYSGAGIHLATDNNTIENINITTCYRGLVLEQSSNNIIQNISINNMVSSGIMIYNHCTNNLLSNIQIENSKWGLYMGDHSNGNEIIYCKFAKCENDGISIYDNCNNNNFLNNLILGNNGNGIFLNNVEYSEIVGNIFRTNELYGLKINSSSTNNHIYHNIFDNNLAGNAYDAGINIWDNGYSEDFDITTEGGNFWSDYSSIDDYHGQNQNLLGSDMIGDTLYGINDTTFDNYPFMYAGGWELLLDLRVYLEAPALLKDLTFNEIVPLSPPYDTIPWNYNGYEEVTEIPNTHIIDWILIELRDALTAELATSETVVARQLAFLRSDEKVVGLDGKSFLHFDYLIQDSLFVVVRHRNHLGIMSSSPLTKSNGIYSYNFTNPAGQAYGFDAQKEILSNKYVMYAADANGDGVVDIQDILLWETKAGIAKYSSSDMNMNGQIDNEDKNSLYIPNEGKSSKIPE